MWGRKPSSGDRDPTYAKPAVADTKILVPVLSVQL